MNYKLPNGRTIRINDDELEKNMRILKLSKDEAIQMYLEDEGYLDNDEQIALETKAKENRITATIHQAKADKTDNLKPKTQRERVLKEDKTKEGLIQKLAKTLADYGAVNVVVVNNTKLITFGLGTDTFKLNLSRDRPPKNK